MSRQLKFRVWDKVVNKYLHPQEALLHSLTGESETELFSIQQYTGLQDRHGKDIYEGDIIIIPDKYPYYDNGNLNYVAVVEWVFAGFQYVLYCIDPYKRGISDGVNEILDEGNKFKVIGNIYENNKMFE